MKMHVSLPAFNFSSTKHSRHSPPDSVAFDTHPYGDDKLIERMSVLGLPEAEVPHNSTRNKLPTMLVPGVTQPPWLEASCEPCQEWSITLLSSLTRVLTAQEISASIFVLL